MLRKKGKPNPAVPHTAITFLILCMVFFYLNLLLGIARKPTNLIYFIFIAVISSLLLEDSQDFPLKKK